MMRPRCPLLAPAWLTPAAFGGPDAPLDLRWLLFGLLALLVLVAWAAIGLDRRLRRDPRLRGLPDAERIWAALDHAPLGILLLEAAPARARAAPADPIRLRHASREARRLVGLSGPETEDDVLPEADWLDALREDRAAARRSSPNGRYRELELEPGRWLRWWVCPLGDLDLVCLLDQSARQAAERSGRQLLGDLSHELRTPLATLLTHLEVQAALELPVEARRNSLALARAEARRMSRLVQDMLALGRLEAGATLNLRPVDLTALAEEALAQLRPQAEEIGVSLSLEAEAGLPLVMADADQLRRVLRNLLDNALLHGAGALRIELGLKREPKAVSCWVRDDGPGIPAAHLAHVTRRFYRAQDLASAPGSGLGLAMVVEILRRHGSRLQIESPAPGLAGGTRACFSLPEAEA